MRAHLDGHEVVCLAPTEWSGESDGGCVQKRTGVMEVGDVNIPNAAKSRDVLDYILERGYRAFEYEDGRIVGHRLRERYEYDNVFLSPDRILGSRGVRRLFASTGVQGGT